MIGLTETSSRRGNEINIQEKEIDMKTKKILSPCVHLNGTSETSLAEQFEAMWTAVDDALEVLAKHGPNGRDYYPYPDIDGQPALYAAQDQHRDRMTRLLSVKSELEVLIINIVRTDREQFVEVGEL